MSARHPSLHTPEELAAGPALLADPHVRSQATVFTLASKDPDDAAVAPRMAVAGIVMVLFQVLTAIGVIGSTTFPSCQTNDQCERGSWCDVAGGAWNAQLHDSTGSQRCHVCGDDLPLPLQISADGRSWNQPDGTLPDGSPAWYTFAGYNRCAARPTIASRPSGAHALPTYCLWLPPPLLTLSVPWSHSQHDG